jgi:hypothetical protein
MIVRKSMSNVNPETGIATYIHCKRCYKDKPLNVSMDEYASNNTGVNLEGDLIVWCRRHHEPVCKLKNEGVGDFLFSLAGTCMEPH